MSIVRKSEAQPQIIGIRLRLPSVSALTQWDSGTPLRRSTVLAQIYYISFLQIIQESFPSEKSELKTQNIDKENYL